jgi:hypothetical protein
MAAQNISLDSTVVETNEVTKSCANDKLTITKYSKENYTQIFFFLHNDIWATKLAI